MKTSRTLRMALLSTTLAGIAGMASAAGTQPGTIIGNSIDLSYTSGGETIQRLNAATVEFVVDRKVDFILESQVSGKVLTVAQGASEEFLVFYLENEGNDVSGYDIDVTPNASGLTLALNADATLAAGEYEVLVGPNAALNDPSDVVYDPAGLISLGDILADGSRYIKIRANIEATATDGASNLFTVVATALDAGTNNLTLQDTGNGLNAVDTIFADAGTDGVEQDISSYQVQAPVLTGTKSATVISENLGGTFNCATGLSQGTNLAAVPGACVEYTITVTNATGASAPASNLIVQDVLPAAVTYVAHDIGTFTTVAYDIGTDTVTATRTSLAAGESTAFTIRVEIE